MSSVVKVIQHIATSHPDAQVSILWPTYNDQTERTSYKTKHFGIKGKDITCDTDISIDTNGKLIIKKQTIYARK